MAINYDDIFVARIQEIYSCIANECYLSALSMALTLPDICGKAAYPECGVTKRYIRWYETYMTAVKESVCPYPSGELVYNLRNSLLHSGNPGIVASEIKNDLCQVDMFILECNQKNAICGGSISRNANGEVCHKRTGISIPLFSELLAEVAMEYYQANKDKFDFFDYTLIV